MTRRSWRLPARCAVAGTVAVAMATMMPGPSGLSAQGPAHAAPAHGVARLAVLVEGSQLSIAMESRLLNLVGFEHQPRSKEQIEAWARMIAVLNAPADLFAPTAAASCTPLRIAIESPWLLADQPQEHDHPEVPAQQDPPEQAALYAEYDFHCDAPAELQGITVDLFAHFPGIVHIQAELVVAGRASDARLDAGRPELRLR
jgi:hypothetical protein